MRIGECFRLASRQRLFRRFVRVLHDQRQVLAAGHPGARLGVDHRRRGEGFHERRRRRDELAGARL